MNDGVVSDVDLCHGTTYWLEAVESFPCPAGSVPKSALLGAWVLVCMKRADVPSELEPVVRRMADVARREDIPEPWEYSLKIFDDGTFSLMLYHLFDEGPIDVSGETPSFDFSPSEYDGVGLEYYWQDESIKKGKIALYTPAELSLSDLEVVESYNAPVDVIESLQNRDVIR